MSDAVGDRGLEAAILRAAKHVYGLARCRLQKLDAKMYRGHDGEMHYGGKGACDFHGSVGGAAQTLETKAVAIPRLELGPKGLKAHQQRDLARAHAAGERAHVVIAFDGEHETYLLPWAPDLAAFCRDPWRDSVSLDMARAWGLLVPDRLEVVQGRGQRVVRFLDGVAHPRREQAAAAVAAERARGRVERKRAVRVVEPLPPAECLQFYDMPVGRERDRRVDEYLGRIAAGLKQRKGRR